MTPREHAEQAYHAWRPHAMEAINQGWAPDDISWTSAGHIQTNLFAGSIEQTTNTPIRVSKAFTEKAKWVACHANPERWDALYRILWRYVVLQEKKILNIESDPDVRRLEKLWHAVIMDSHHMKGFLRFHEIDTDLGPQLVAHYEPDHRILGWIIPHFLERLGNTDWSILTPHASVTVHQGDFQFGPGVKTFPGINQDDIAKLWCEYYEAHFNPERKNDPLFDRTLPQRYRRHLTEASIIEQTTSNT